MNDKKEKLLSDTYNKWMQTGLHDLPLDDANDFVNPNIMGYGTAIDEKVLSISDYRILINKQREQAVGLEMSFELTPVFRSISNKEDSAIFVDEIKVSIILKDTKQELILRITTILEYIDSIWKVVHWHGSKPEHISGGDDPWHVTEWKRKNEELQKLVDEKTSELLNKNRELEIEAALEKVRSSALAMKGPSDMVDVCRIISDQLQTLGIANIRNVQTAIINEQKSTYLNYQYFTSYNKSTIEEAEYNKHPKAREMAESMKRSANASYSQSFDGKDLDVFRQYRKHDNQFPDPILEEAASLHFYFYSIGPGALGLSTYNFPLNEKDLIILKRFRNVFELAYRRFLDIQQAEAQAREAKIEAALERVRSRTMGMQKSEELKEVIRVVYEQFVHLKINVDHAGFVVDYKPKGDWHFWIADEQDIPSKITHPYFESLWANQFNEAKENGADFFITNLNFEEKNKFYNELLSFVPGLPKASKEFYLSCPGLAISTVLLENVSLYIENFSGIRYSDEENKTLMRFGKVFQQTYTRFLDLQRAEAQNKIIQAENDRKTKELEDARQLQLSMLPKELPQLPHLDIAVYMKTATEVGGDYYDFNVDANGTLTILVGDATGHGMMSGMMVSIMKSFFIADRNKIELKQFFENANNSIKDMQLGRLMMALAGIQITSDKIIATNAGMPSLLYFRNKSQKAGEFVSHNLPLGGMKNTNYSLKEIKYEKGDTLLLMSDGFAELKNEKNEQYGYERVKEEFLSIAKQSPHEIVEHLKNSSSQWINGIEPDDDVTFVVIKVK